MFYEEEFFLKPYNRKVGQIASVSKPSLIFLYNFSNLKENMGKYRDIKKMTWF